MDDTISQRDPGPGSNHDPLEDGLVEAFAKDAVRPLSASVLSALQSRTNSVLGVHIDSPGADDVPVRVTEEARAMRDPLGRYQVLGEVGRGGVGIVYKGRDQDLGRDVAMKVLRDEHADNPEVLARFVEEAQIGGQLQHPGIVPVYELGLQSGQRPYFAMKLVKGETLAAQLTRRAVLSEDRRRFYGVFEQICQTMAYAHSRHVVHRDLKPANVMIGAFGEVQVVDWGFAKVLEKGGNADEKAAIRKSSVQSVIATVRSRPGSGTHSVVGSMLGTPAYMPPEQALGDLEHLDTRSDVFGLGAILCEILTGSPPYLEADGDVIRQAATGDLSAAHERLRRSGADQAMIGLAIECLSRTRQARPGSAAELAKRVSAHLTSVEARASRAELHAAEARHRQRQTLISAVATILVLVVGGAAWTWIEASARGQRQAAAARVATAMSDLREARGRATASGLDLVAWEAAAKDATHLQGLVDAEGVDEAQRAQVGELLASFRTEYDAARASVARTARDDEMRRRLRAVRIPLDDDLRSRENAARELVRLDEAYRAAFAAYLGGERTLENTVTPDALTALRDGSIAVELAAALDHLAFVRDQLPDQDSVRPLTARVRELAMLLDPGDTWRSELRLVMASPSGQRERVRELADRADLAKLTAVHCDLLAEALRQADAPEEAVRVLRHAREEYPTDFGLALSLAVHMEKVAVTDWPGVVGLLEVARALEPSMVEVLHRQGMALERLRRYDDSRRIFTRLLDWADRSEGAARRRAHWHSHIGSALLSQGHVDEARAAIERAVDTDPVNPRYHTQLGNLLDDLGKPEEALACYQRALESDPDYASAHRNVGIALEHQGRYDEAKRCYERAIEVDPKDGAAYVALGGLFASMDKVGEAISYYRRAIAKEPKLARAHYRLGRALLSLGRVDEALASYERGIAADAGDPNAKAWKAYALNRMGRANEAIPLLYIAIDADPENGEMLHALGEAFSRVGRHREALPVLRKALDVWSAKRDAHSQAHAKGLELGVESAVAFVEKEVELMAIARGERDADSAQQWHYAAQLAYLRGDFLAGYRTIVRAFAALPDMVGKEGYATMAAAVALRAAAPPTDGSEPLPEAERATMRAKALAWLEGDLPRWIAQSDVPMERKFKALHVLQEWLTSTDFVSVRSEEARALLPAEEAARWERLWRDVGRNAREWMRL